MDIKEEIDENFIYNINSPLPQIVQDSNSKCGEVYLSNNGNFLFHCDICNTKFENFNFFLHISTDHAEILYKRNSETIKSTTNTLQFEMNNCNPEQNYSLTSTVNAVTTINNAQLNYDQPLSTIKENYFNKQSPTREYNCNTTNKYYDWESQIEAIINFIRNTPKHCITGHSFKVNKAKIFQPLSEQLNISIEQILKKFKYLKSKLALEKRVLLERRSKNDYQYEPTWGWYESFKFWDDELVTISTKSSSSTTEDSTLNIDSTKRKFNLVCSKNNVNDIKKPKNIEDIKTYKIKIPKKIIDETSQVENNGDPQLPEELCKEMDIKE